MANALTATLAMQLNWKHAKNQAGLNDTLHLGEITRRLLFRTGSGAGEADELVSQTRTIAPGVSEVLDLTSSLSNLVGDSSVTFARIKGLFVQLLGADETSLGTACTSILIGNAATQPWPGFLGDGEHTMRVYNGGFAALAVGNAEGVIVEDGVADRLRVTNEDELLDAVYRIVLLGAKT
jgi:hypothetical protein